LDEEQLGRHILLRRPRPPFGVFKRRRPPSGFFERRRPCGQRAVEVGGAAVAGRLGRSTLSRGSRERAGVVLMPRSTTSRWNRTRLGRARSASRKRSAHCPPCGGGGCMVRIGVPFSTVATDGSGLVE
jgi:hypothetical protein